MIFVDGVAHHAIRNPQAMAVCIHNADVSYEAFDRNINQVANLLAARLNPGARVAVMVDNQFTHWLLLLALGRLGAISVSLDPAKYEMLLEVVRPDAVLTDRALTGPYSAVEMLVTPAWLKETLASGNPQPLARLPRLDEPARIITSSGTTGRPKKILFTHGDVIRRIKGAYGLYPPGHNDRLLSLMGVDTLGGFTAFPRTWWLGGTACLFSPIPALIIARNVTGILASPRQMQTLVKRLPAGSRPLPNLSVTTGGHRMSRELSLLIRLRLASTAIVMYGSTEAGAVAAGPLSLLDRDPDVTGIVLPGHEVEAVDQAGRPVAPGVVGEIRVRTQEMCAGYLEDDAATARHFRDGWFYPGDVGSVSALGELRILGRVDDVLNAGGVKIAPEVIEEILMTVPGIDDVGVFSMTDAGTANLWAAVVASGPVDFAAAQALVNRRMASGNAPLRFVSVPSIPRNSMGKVQRFELRAQAAALSSSGRPTAPAALQL